MGFGLRLMAVFVYMVFLSNYFGFLIIAKVRIESSCAVFGAWWIILDLLRYTKVAHAIPGLGN